MKRLNVIGIGYLATLALSGLGSQQAQAATITFDSEIYDFFNPSTCTSQLSEGKCFQENGLNVEAFSARNIGSESSYFDDGSHFHARNGYEAQHFISREDDPDIGRFGLLGAFITLEDGGLFSLDSLDYQLRNNENAIEGYQPDDTKILISTAFDPTQPVAGQFTEYSIGNDISLPFQTLSVDGFDNITQVYIASSGDVNFDNVTLTPIPEPGLTLGLLILGTSGATVIASRKQS